MTAKTKEPSKGGRPSSYKTEYVELALHFSRLGATDKDMADAFDVSEVTLNAWKQSHPEFLKSLKEGKLLADARVSTALYTRATGYEKNDKHYPPDTTACIFWLKNRQPDKWRDKTEVATDSTTVVEALKSIADKLPD
jgi:hypothetical protein